MNISDFIKCPVHGVYCVISTGVRPCSSHFGKSFYYCSVKVDPCHYRKNTNLGIVKCPNHPDEIITVRKLTVIDSVSKCYYQCQTNKLTWCGNVKLELAQKVPESTLGKTKDLVESTLALKVAEQSKEAHGSLKQLEQKSQSEIQTKTLEPTKLKMNGKEISLSDLEASLRVKKNLYESTNKYLPDKGQKLLDQIESLKFEIRNWKHNEVTSQLDNKVKSTFSKPEFVTSLNSDFKSSLLKDSAFKYDYPVSNPLYVGPNNAARREKIVTVTLAAVEHLHESLKSKPKDFEEEDVSNGLVVSLMEHQRQGLKWALWRESQHPPGGIIADDMGLGKTVLMIALIVKKKMMDIGGSPKLPAKCPQEKLIATGCTLIICPTTLMHHWESEVKNKCRPNMMSVIVYHGPRRVSNASRLALADVIITTYDIVRNEIPTPKDDDVKVRAESPLLRLSFCRIVLDEGHIIKNPKTNINKAVCRLHARFRWVLTGTPIHNCLKDMYSLLKFLRCSPFDEEGVWRHWVDNGTGAGQARLKSIVESLLLRRTKNQTGRSGKPIINLPPKENFDEVLTLSEFERQVHDELLLHSRNVLVKLLQKKDSGGDVHVTVPSGRNVNSALSSMVSRSIPDTANMAKVLVLLLRMQQCCCHLSLLKLDVDQSSDDVDELTKQLEDLTLTNGCSTKPLFNKSELSVLETNKMNPALEKSFASTKIEALMAKLKMCMPTGKCVVVSQWSSYLDIIGNFLLEANIEYCEISGRIPPKDRGDIVDRFNIASSGPKVMLLSLKAGGVGLNLTGGRYLFLLDIHWNPALEAQACDRIHRVGQKYNVKIFRFVCENTVERKIVELHVRKLQLAKNVLEGQNSKTARLTLQDLRMLFGV